MVVARALTLFQAAVGTAVYRGRNFAGGMRTISMVGARFQQTQQEPTYGDVFNTRGNLRDKPITPEDTERMRNAEAATVGQTVKGGTAARMQSAVSRANPTPAAGDVAGSVFEDDNLGVGSGTKKMDPTDHPITIGEALEAAAENIGDKPVERKDARVIQSAEGRATGNAPGVKRVVAAEAQSAADKNAVGSTTAIPAVRDVLSNASEKMPVDKVVTHEDAAKVQSVEQRNSPTGRVDPGGIAATLQSAADKNAAAGVEPQTGAGGRIPNK